MIKRSDAQKIVLENVSRAGKSEKTPLMSAMGKVIGAPIVSDRDIPPFDRAKMDGYCFNSADLNLLNSTGLKDSGTIKAGSPKTFTPKEGEAYKIMTGGSVPPEMDSIIKIEDCDVQGNLVLSQKLNYEIKESFIGKKGEDAPCGKVLVEAGNVINPAVAAVAASVGYAEVETHAPPKISIMASGDEIVPIEEVPKAYQIRDCNSTACRLICWKYGIKTQSPVTLADRKDELFRRIFEELATCDALILTGGVSMGDYDFIPGVLNDIGVRKLFHRVAIRPGKPVWFGMDESGTLIFGLPGNPVSVQVTFKLFVEPFIKKFMGYPNPIEQPVYFTLVNEFSKGFELDYFFPIKVVDYEDMTVEAYHLNSSGDYSGFALADGIGIMPAKDFKYSRGERLGVFLWK